ncbi:MAG: nitroreductase family protein [Ignavibacteriae bacterium]|nr:MAG: nitroreductase family protein [Ignavibacteriota bacterium]
MDIFEAIQNRRTTNTAFIDKSVSEEHIEKLIKMASCAPSHFNSQPWRFVVITDKNYIHQIGKIAGDSMVQLMEDGRFWKQYNKYFRFSEDEIEKTKDGIFIDHVPMVLRPFIRTVMSETGGKVLAKLKVPKILGKDEEELVAGSPMLFAISLTKDEYKKDELPGMYSLISMGAVIQNLWLTTTALGMGMQFISTPCEIPEKWNEIVTMLNIPEDYEMLAIFRMGYVKEDMKRPSIDWKSSQRKSIEELAYRNKWGNNIINS